MNVVKSSRIRLPVRTIPPFRIFAQQMDSARKLCANRLCHRDRGRQPVGPRNDNPKFRLSACHRLELPISSKNPNAQEFKLQGIFKLRASWVPK